jgi:imidazolonepropionase-like amidohydrolase
MLPPMPPRFPTAAALVAVAVALAIASPHAATAAPPPAYPGGKMPRVHALTGARLVLSPGEKVVESGTVIIRDGLIAEVGAGSKVSIPAAARVWDLAGRTIYPGLIEPHLRLDGEADDGDDAGNSAAGAPTSGKLNGTGPRNATAMNPRVRSELRVAEELATGAITLPPKLLSELREAGFTAALVVPGEGVFRGASALVNLTDQADPERVVLRPDVAQHVAFEHGDADDRDGYPNSLMGSVALIRQTLLDAEHHALAWSAYEQNPRGLERPEANRALAALEPAVKGRKQEQKQKPMPLAFEAEDAQTVLRTSAIASEFDLAIWVVSGGCDDYKWPQVIRDSRVPLVLALNFPLPPLWDEEEETINIDLATLRHWELAPSNPRRLQQEGVAFAFTAQGLVKREDWRERVRHAVSRGLPASTALAAVTTEPAKLLGVGDRLGTIARGKIANLTVTDGNLFDLQTNVLEVWVDGQRYEPDPKAVTRKEVSGEWELALDRGSKAAPGAARVKFSTEGGELIGTLIEGAPPDTARFTLPPPELEWGRLAFTLPGRVVGLEGDTSIAVQGEVTPTRNFEGEWQADRNAAGQTTRGAVRGRKRRGPPATEPAPAETLLAGFTAPYPPLPEAAPDAILIRGATIWTAGEEGTLSEADLLVRGGKIAAVGKTLAAPRGALVIDAKGKHVTPGIIDCHSHSALSGGTNESTHSATAEVRIGDVVDAESIQIYRQLAGGVTAINLLHGSANVIGSQNAVLKLRFGEPPAKLRFAGAPPGIKFALGENVKQSNWGDEYTTRYPQTRMGVEAWLRDRFLAARDYQRTQEEWRKSRDGIPPRRDLQLEALSEILDGKRLVHCHAYRQDEMLMLMRVAEEFGFRVRTFQHVLEGYKVANEMAAHGVGASAFSDWWAFKFETYDAIPYNAAIMKDRGVVVSFNSDSSELARRLNTEAAKAVKYGGMSEVEALRLVTANPAIQLDVDRVTGTLAPGKDADFALWDGSPLSNFARCIGTWVDGRRYFDRERDLAARPAANAERAALLAKAHRMRFELESGDPKVDVAAWQPTFGASYGTNLDAEGRGTEMGVCE